MPDFLQKLCGLLTGHRWFQKYDILDHGKRYCRCRICGHHFWKED